MTDDELDDDFFDEPELDPEEVAHAEAIRQMYELHRDVGRKAMEKALQALDQINPSDIPINVAVQLLKFGADLERRAVLGIEPEGEQDPFAALSGSVD
jgi:hypothetical protein